MACQTPPLSIAELKKLLRETWPLRNERDTGILELLDHMPPAQLGLYNSGGNLAIRSLAFPASSLISSS